MVFEGGRSVLVYDAEQDTWDLFEESEIPLLDGSRFSAEWVFDGREEAQTALQMALGAEDRIPASVLDPGSPRDVDADS